MSTWLPLLLGILLGFPLLLNSEETIDPNEDDESYKRCANSETGERYREAETWTEYDYERCAECMCMKAGPECHETECVGPCVEESIEYNVGESWKRDACTTCTCVGGEMPTQCMVMDCMNPADCKTEVVSRSGECCPVCIDDCATVRCAMPSDCQYGIMYPPDQCCPVCKVDECADVYCPEDCGNSMVSGGCCPACDWQVSSSQNLARFTSVFVQTLMIISTGELCWT